MLTRFLWLWFQCVCPLMPSCNTYRLTWVFLTLEEGYLLMAAPPDLECGVAPLGPPLPAQSLLLGRGVAGPITSWQIDGETERGTDFILGGSKITADGDCSNEIKRRLLLGRKVMPNLDSILKSWDITLPTKVYLVKVMVFPVVIYGCESWTIKKAECWRIDAFELWCWRKLLRVPWTSRRSNQSILKEISPECSLEGLMLKLKLQSFGRLMWRIDSLEKTLMLGKIEVGRRKGTTEDEMVGWHCRLNGHEFE